MILKKKKDIKVKQIFFFLVDHSINFKQGIVNF